jgi:hypothetical protein
VLLSARSAAIWTPNREVGAELLVENVLMAVGGAVRARSG